MQNLRTRVRALARETFEATRADRRHLHAHPELSFEERETQSYVAGRLNELGIRYREAAGTGLIAEIGPGTEKTVALRADMDALPIAEKNDVDYRSKNEGVMHACGHDVHTACLLGAARILKRLEKELPHRVRLLFQPGEEKLPGGATLMIRDGALDDPTPTAIYGQHVHPPLEAGKVGFRPGIYMASTDELYLTVRGRGGHGALPHKASDPIVIAAQVVVALQQLVSRESDPTLPVVLTFGKINSVGGATNVIPNEVRLEGTLRTLDEEWRAELHQRLHRTVAGLAKALGGSAEIDIRHGYPFLKNDETLTQRAMDAARDLLGPENVVELPIRMTGEDFAFYTHRVPACFYRLGVKGDRGGGPVHTDTFDADERCLVTGAGVMAYVAATLVAKL